MKYKYIVGILVALSFNNAFGADADETINHGDYQEMYLAFSHGGCKEINAALANNPTFNNKEDVDDILLSCQTGFALRKAVIGLSAPDLQAVVERNHEFFKTSLGVSLVYGWTLRTLNSTTTPYYIDECFSFDKLFQGMADKINDSQVSTFLKSTFTLGLRAVDADRWAFYDHMLYLPYAIEQMGISGPSALSIDEVLKMSHRTKAEAKSERAYKAGRAADLMNEASFYDPDENLIDHGDDTALARIKQLIIQIPELFTSLDAHSKLALEILVSLPADTPGSYEFLGYALNNGSADSHHYFLKTVAVRESRRLTLGYFETKRRTVIERISKEIDTAQGFKKLELLKDALWIINNPSFLSNVEAFPEYMATKDVNNGLDAKLVQILAKYTKEKENKEFMKEQQAYKTVISYADDQYLRGTFWRYEAERASILEVLAALKAEYKEKTLTEDRSAGSVWKDVADVGEGD